MDALCQAVDIVVTDHGEDLSKFLIIDKANQTKEINLTEVSRSSSTHSTCETSDDEEHMNTKKHVSPWNWRNENSFSDFTIEVVIMDAVSHSSYRPVQIFRVHKIVLSMGDKKSRYFAKLFQQVDQQRNSHDNDYAHNKCQIQLSALTAKAIPIFLDYMYSVPANPSIFFTSENASSLYYISRILQVDRLRKEVKLFWQEDVALSNCLLYFRHATLLNERKIQDAVVRTCILNLSKIKLNSDILVHYDALPLWLNIAASRHRTRSTHESFHLNVLIACFCKLHQQLLTFDIFIKLTDIKYLPSIHQQVAGPLLDLCKVFEATKKPSVDSQSILLNLQIRCLDSLAESWDVCAINPSFHQILTKLNASELSYLLMTSLATAHDEIGVLRIQKQKIVEQNALLQQSHDSILKELDFVIQDRNICNKELNFMKRKHEGDVDELEPVLKRTYETGTSDASVKNC
jgi:BTB/POZ domain